MDMMFSLGHVTTNYYTYIHLYCVNNSIDNMSTIGIDSNITSGLYVTDIRDHWPAFDVCKSDGR